MSRMFGSITSSFSCLSQTIPDSPISSKSIPIIGLVNGLSGGHKGDKVQRLLNSAKIPAFDLLRLSTDDDYFTNFIRTFVQIYDNIIMEELFALKNKTDDNFHLHPRILICGGDGTIAWALSLLDRALVAPELVRIFWRRSRIIDNISDIDDSDNIDHIMSVKQQLSKNNRLSQSFYYSVDMTQSTTHENESDHVDCNNNNNINNTNQTQPQSQQTDESTSDQADIYLENEQKINDEYVSSASLSAQDEAQIIEEFINQPLSIITSPDKHERLFKKQQLKEMNDEIKINDDMNDVDDIDINNMNNDSLSESLVTREELQCVLSQKQTAAVINSQKSLDDLRILQGIYSARIGPAIALVPLGTGNDLSRCLGTGFSYPGSKELITNLLKQYKTAPLTKLDRWKIQFFETDNVALKKRQTSEMLCYFSVGFEGQIAYKFSTARNNNPKLFDRPWKNKIQYAFSGIGPTIQQAFGITKPLNNDIECYVDGEKLILPSNTRSLVVSNIQSMADGVFFWGKGAATKKDMKNSSEPMLGDGKLEIMAAKGIYKYLQMRVGMSHYRRLAQPKKVKIIMKTELPIQLDGESWIESKGVVEIYLLHQVFAVVGKNEPRGIRII